MRSRYCDDIEKKKPPQEKIEHNRTRSGAAASGRMCMVAIQLAVSLRCMVKIVFFDVRICKRVSPVSSRSPI